MTTIGGGRHRCCCGAGLAGSPPWCPRCYLPLSAAESTSGRALPADLLTVRPHRPILFEAFLRRGTTVSYGLPGRLIATALVTLPVLLFLKVLIPFGFVGVVAYSAVYPRALRDIWARR